MKRHLVGALLPSFVAIMVACGASDNEADTTPADGGAGDATSTDDVQVQGPSIPGTDSGRADTGVDAGPSCGVNNGGCHADAVCDSSSGKVVCTCKQGYAGDGGTCGDVDECATNNGGCSPNATCANTSGGRTCTCTPPFSGDGGACTDGVDDCAANPCQNGGTCADGVNTYSCTCAAGYSGTNCETNINDCAANPCQNGGTCADGVNTYSCTCATGYSGTNCETNINDCAPNPCQNGGTCADGVNTYTCTCANGYTGPRCTVPPASCLGIKTANPAATDGIYTIDPDGVGGAAAFPVYCDMTTSGGGWTLTARWTGVSLNQWSHQEVCGTAGNIRTATTDTVTFPVPPDDAVAPWGTTCMVKPGNPTFIATYGAYLTYPAGALNGAALGVTVNYSVAGDIPSSSAWGLWGDSNLTNFSIIPAVTNGGLCGGPDVCASMACPSSRAWNACHWDQGANVQQVFRR